MIGTPVLVEVPAERELPQSGAVLWCREKQELPMSELIALVMSSTAVTAVLAAVYVGSGDPGRQARALELIRLILGR